MGFYACNIPGMPALRNHIFIFSSHHPYAGIKQTNLFHLFIIKHESPSEKLSAYYQ